MNNFTFNYEHYLQKLGTAMGTRMAPSYANLPLGKFEHNALLRAPYQPYVWLRFIDDIFMTSTKGPEKLDMFVDYLNILHSTIEFTCSHSLSNVPFLDVMVSVKDGFIKTDLYTKPTDKHQYLLITSCHPHHTKRSIPYSFALCLRRICSNHDSYILRTNELIDYLINRGYDKTFLKTQIQRACKVPRADALKDKPVTRTTTTPFVITYNPALLNIAHIIHQHSHVLYSSDRGRNVFENLPLVAYRRCDNISDILITAHLPETRDLNNSQTTPGSFRCNSRNCTTRLYIDHGRNKYTFHSTGETYRIKSHIACNTFNVIYVNVNCVIYSILGKPNAALKTVLMNIDVLYLIH